MEIKRKDSQSRMCAEIYPFADTKRGTIYVERRRSLMARLETWEDEASVSWSSLGSMPATEAAQYANAILAACRLAEEMNAVRADEFTTPGGYMVIYRQGEHETWERIEEGQDIPTYKGWTVEKATRTRAGRGDSDVTP